MLFKRLRDFETFEKIAFACVQNFETTLDMLKFYTKILPLTIFDIYSERLFQLLKGYIPPK